MEIFVIKDTPARTSVLEFLRNANAPVDILQIIDFLRSKNLHTNKVTVYRIMEFLLKNQIVEKLEFREGKYRYELKKHHHHHLICNKCGKVQDINGEVIEKLEKEIQKNKSFIVQSHSLEFFGLCKDCQN